MAVRAFSELAFIVEEMIDEGDKVTASLFEASMQECIKVFNQPEGKLSSEESLFSA